MPSDRESGAILLLPCARTHPPPLLTLAPLHHWQGCNDSRCPLTIGNDSNTDWRPRTRSTCISPRPVNNPSDIKSRFPLKAGAWRDSSLSNSAQIRDSVSEPSSLPLVSLSLSDTSSLPKNFKPKKSGRGSRSWHNSILSSITSGTTETSPPIFKNTTEISPPPTTNTTKISPPTTKIRSEIASATTKITTDTAPTTVSTITTTTTTTTEVATVSPTCPYSSCSINRRCGERTCTIKPVSTPCQESITPKRTYNGLILFLTMATLFGIGGSNERPQTVVNISADKQIAWMELATLQCHQKMLQTPLPPSNVTMCPRTWDSLLCWPDTEPGKIATQLCPNYVNGFQPWENATRQCMKDGTWFFHPDLNQTWTNLTLCRSDLLDPLPEDNGAEFIKSHMGRIRLMYSWGYGLSLASLLLSVIIMLGFKRLHCPRNTIHLNLFMSFILRAAISFMKEKLLVAGLGFSFDLERDEEADGFIFRNDSSHWECKLFFTCFNYILGANYMWILVEGLYLCTLVSWAVFSEKSFIRLYILFGWSSPLWFVIPWVIVRALKEDVLCWNTHPTEGYFWIMRGPIVASILINFGIFVYIIVILCQKLTAVNSPEAQKFRYRKLARSTLVLIPLFGVHYVVFLFLPKDVHPTTQLVQLYFEMFFNSIQGFLVAVLFCFMNSEVQNEIKKKWHRFRLTYLNHVIQSRTTDSCTHTTSATFLSRPPESKWSAARLQDSRQHHHQHGRDGGTGGGGRWGRFRKNSSSGSNQESATMLLPLGQSSSNSPPTVQENGGNSTENFSSNDDLDRPDATPTFW